MSSQVRQIRSYSAYTSPGNTLNLKSFFITGLADAEGTFGTVIRKSNSTRLG